MVGFRVYLEPVKVKVPPISLFQTVNFFASSSLNSLTPSSFPSKTISFFTFAMMRYIPKFFLWANSCDISCTRCNPYPSRIHLSTVSFHFLPASIRTYGRFSTFHYCSLATLSFCGGLTYNSRFMVPDCMKAPFMSSAPITKCRRAAIKKFILITIFSSRAVFYHVVFFCISVPM